jgi:hypothetical protein
MRDEMAWELKKYSYNMEVAKVNFDFVWELSTGSRELLRRAVHKVS